MYPDGKEALPETRKEKPRPPVFPGYSYFIFGYMITKKGSGQFCMHWRACVYSRRGGGYICQGQRAPGPGTP